MPLPSEFLAPFLYTVMVWWLGTGVVLYLDGRPPHTFRATLRAATWLAGIAFVAVLLTRSDTTVRGAYVAFTAAVVIWAWNELAFLLGFVTGPRRRACDPSCRGVGHFFHAANAILHHELALLGTAALLAIATWTAPNPVAAWTFVALWAMRLGTKLNVFFGVPNLSEGLLPDHLRYLARYFRRRSMNAFFPLSVTLATAATIVFAQRFAAATPGSFDAAAAALLTALLGLGVLEHWFLVLPIPSEWLWRWGLRSRDADRSPAAGAIRVLRGGLDSRRAAVDEERTERRRDR
jgi:putative photosynthetic complex assembly protein 2